jgi:hypothetical protein
MGRNLSHSNTTTSLVGHGVTVIYESTPPSVFEDLFYAGRCGRRGKARLPLATTSREFYPNFAEGELLGGVLSKNIHVFNENMRENLCCA